MRQDAPLDEEGARPDGGSGGAANAVSLRGVQAAAGGPTPGSDAAHEVRVHGMVSQGVTQQRCLAVANGLALVVSLPAQHSRASGGGPEQHCSAWDAPSSRLVRVDGQEYTLLSCGRACSGLHVASPIQQEPLLLRRSLRL